MLTESDLYDLSDDGFFFYGDKARPVVIPCVHAVLRFHAVRLASDAIDATSALVLTLPYSTMGGVVESVLGACVCE